MRWRQSVVLFVAVVLASCGSSAADSPETPSDAIREFLSAVNAEDWERACALSVQPPGGGDCERVLGQAFSGHEGEVATAHGVSMNGGQGDFLGQELDLKNAPHGFSMRVEQVDPAYRIHWETQVID
jgi:hypothetical protein